MNSSTIVLSALAVFVLFSVLGCGCTEPESSETGQQNTTVPVEEAWGQAAVSLLEQYALFNSGCEIIQSFNGTTVSREPLMLYDSEGGLLYYRFPVFNADGVNYSNCSVQVSADKRLGKTVTNIGSFIINGEILSLNSSQGGEVLEKRYFVSGTPLLEYGDRYGSLMVDFWENENQYAENVLTDLKEAGIDISKPVAVENLNLIRKILAENIGKREDGKEDLENEYQVEWNS